MTYVIDISRGHHRKTTKCPDSHLILHHAALPFAAKSWFAERFPLTMGLSTLAETRWGVLGHLCGGSTELSSLVVFLQGSLPNTADFALRAGLPRCPVARNKIPVPLSLVQQRKPAPCPLETPESLGPFHFWATPSSDSSSFLHLQNNPFDEWLLSLVIILCPPISSVLSHPAVLQTA